MTRTFCAAMGCFVLAAAMVAGGCKTPKLRDESTVESPRSGDFTPTDGGAIVRASTLGPGDLVEVRVHQEADLSGVFRISPEGTIDFPLCGKVRMSGTTSSEAADALTSCLGSKYLRSPQVTVLVREYTSKKIFVFGEVQKPGTFPYEDQMSIIQAITIAGGFTKLAAKNSISVTRLVDGAEKKMRIAVEDIGTGRERNFFLQPGDIVFVPESFF
jgi:protein involved in polysaccharide export with SLBB domain